MGLFSKKKKDETPVSVNAPAPVAVTPAGSGGLNLEKKSGAISLEKGARVLIEKTPLIAATCSWSSNTDYDLYALVLMKDGTQKYVSTFGSATDRNPDMSILNGAVKHLGDVTSGKSEATETVEIQLNPSIAAVVPIAYSAQSNGAGSFKKYKVSLGIDNKAGTVVSIDAKNANNDNNIYTVAVGIIWNDDNGVRIEAAELYSKRNSENRPLFVNGVLTMDAGAKNLYK